MPLIRLPGMFTRISMFTNCMIGINLCRYLIKKIVATLNSSIMDIFYTLNALFTISLSVFMPICDLSLR